MSSGGGSSLARGREGGREGEGEAGARGCEGVYRKPTMLVSFYYRGDGGGKGRLFRERGGRRDE